MAVDVISSGGAFRDLAMARYPDLTKVQALAALEEAAMTDKTVDQQVDNRTLSAICSCNDFIFDSRIAPHFGEKVKSEVSDSYHFYYVHLVCSPWTSATRVAARDNEVDIKKVTRQMIHTALSENRHRISVSGSRYRDQYGIQSLKSQVERWDRVFDTGKISTEGLVEVIMRDFTEKGWIG